MKKFEVCIQSYLWNNSDFKEYDSYYILAIDKKDAREKVQKSIDEMNSKKDSSIIYSIYSIDEVIKK